MSGLREFGVGLSVLLGAVSLVAGLEMHADKVEQVKTMKAVTMEEKSLLKPLVEVLKYSRGIAYGVSVWENGGQKTVQITPATRCHNTYSVAKLFTVTAIGMLVDRGKIDLDEPVYPILKDYFPKTFDETWKRVTVADVMRHRWGMDKAGFLDIDMVPMNGFPSEDFLTYVLSQPLPKAVGEDHVYTDAAYYLMSRIFTVRSGEKLDAFLRRELLNPLHFAEYAFATCPQGYPMGATGMYISTEDMCKLGRLYLQKGLWEGRRILSEAFVKEAFERGLELHVCGEAGGYSKGGAYGQLLYMNPKSGRVVSIHGFQLDLRPVIEYLSRHDVR